MHFLSLQSPALFSSSEPLPVASSMDTLRLFLGFLHDLTHCSALVSFFKVALSVHLRAFSPALLAVPTDTHVTLQSHIKLCCYFNGILFNIPI